MDTILYPLMVPVAWIMVQFHTLLTALGLEETSGAAWGLSIVGLVIVIRIALIPLFVKQIKASRGMQLLSPELQAIQKKYKGKSDPASREAMSRETMELYRKHGTNPFSSCLPILAQSPIFFALFQVLYNLEAVATGTYPRESIGPLTPELAAQANEATIWGAPLSSSFLSPDATMNTRVVSVVLIIAMSVTTFTTQRQLTQKNMPASALQGPMAQQQKMLLYVLPLVFAVSGVNFPIGVLIYWTTTNLWSMGQQFYVIRRNPTPGSEAERLLKERRARKAAAKGIVLPEEAPPAIEEKPRGQRQQPKRKERRPGGPTTGGSPGADGPSDTTASASVPADKPASTGSTKPAGAGSAKGTGAGTSKAAGPATSKTAGSGVTKPATAAPRSGTARPKAGTTPTQRAGGAAKTTGGGSTGTAPTPRRGSSKPAGGATSTAGTPRSPKKPSTSAAAVETPAPADPTPDGGSADGGTPPSAPTPPTTQS